MPCTNAAAEHYPARPPVGGDPVLFILGSALPGLLRRPCGRRRALASPGGAAVSTASFRIAAIALRKVNAGRPYVELSDVRARAVPARARARHT